MRSVSTTRKPILPHHPPTTRRRLNSNPSPNTNGTQVSKRRSSAAKIPSLLRFYSAAAGPKMPPMPQSVVGPSAGTPIRRAAAGGGRLPPRLKREDATVDLAWLQKRMVMEEKLKQGGVSSGGSLVKEPMPMVGDLVIREGGVVGK